MIVLVHGVPESAALWDKVRERLDGPSTALALPGFACPRPDGFGATRDDYAAWLVGELEAIDEPVDLVGHDWGAALTYRVATTRGDLLRSWAADVANVMHPRTTRGTTSPRSGRQTGRARSSSPHRPACRPRTWRPDTRRWVCRPADAGVLVPLGDPVMASCIMDLYRSATPRIFDHWGDAMTADHGAGPRAARRPTTRSVTRCCRARWPSMLGCRGGRP